MSAMADVYEKLGAFYLGRPLDPDSGETLAAPLLYDSKDLVTHAMCVGMTGSGKTGLCISLLEEAAIDGIPALILDVKGDLGNLLLTFPELRGRDFRPWINEEDAARKGLTAEQYAHAQAELWKNGLGEWDQDGDRIARLRAAAEFAIYTPGSEAGLPISILSSFRAPADAAELDADLLQERVGTTVSSLLGLLGIDADPLRSREHILLANLLTNAWKEGRDLDMSSLIQGIQEPPFDRVGVLSLDSFYPAKDRFELAMAVNNLLAAPGFQSWMKGDSLEIDRLLYTPSGKPRVAIFTISHLDDAERMFFVSLLLNQVLGWMRSRSGTTSLRALVYMDEIFGYLPPVANPPSKRPLLTMLKQARAFGVGLVLATQNPVDLDYKALSNIGTWFLGRLQTERDKKRVLDGLEGAGEGALSRRELERALSDLGKRVFLLHNVHEDGPVKFKVRWAMSYLRGPLTRNQIQELTAGQELEGAGAEPGEAAAPIATPEAVAAEPEELSRPLLPPGVEEVFLPLPPGEADPVYRAQILGAAKVHFVDSRKGLEAAEELYLLAPWPTGVGGLDWSEARPVEISLDDLEPEPTEGGRFTPLPESGPLARRFTTWKKAWKDSIYRTRRFPLRQNKTLELYSRPGESERDFKIRLAEVAREKRDRESAALREKLGRKLDTLLERIRRAEQKVEKEKEQAQSQKLRAVMTVGSTLLGALLGRKTFSSTNMRRAGTAVRGFGRASKERQDVERAEDDLQALLEQHEELEAELQAALVNLATEIEAEVADTTTFELKPRKTDIDIRLVAVAWVPCREEGGFLQPFF